MNGEHGLVDKKKMLKKQQHRLRFEHVHHACVHDVRKSKTRTNFFFSLTAAFDVEEFAAIVGNLGATAAFKSVSIFAARAPAAVQQAVLARALFAHRRVVVRALIPRTADAVGALALVLHAVWGDEEEGGKGGGGGGWWGRGETKRLHTAVMLALARKASIRTLIFPRKGAMRHPSAFSMHAEQRARSRQQRWGCARADARAEVR